MSSWTRAFLVAAAFAAQAFPAAAGGAEPSRPACLPDDETRQTIVTRKLVPPVRAVDAALRAAPGESVGIRLCRRGEVMVYDVVVLRPDGRLVHIVLDAVTGALLPGRAGT